MGSTSFVLIRMFEKVSDIFKVNDCMFDKIPFGIILIEVWIIRFFEKKFDPLIMVQNGCVDKTKLNNFKVKPFIRPLKCTFERQTIKIGLIQFNSIILYKYL